MNSSDQCPLCGTELSKTKLGEIEAKLAEQEQQRLLEQRKKLAEVEVAARKTLELEFQKKLAAQTEAAAKLARQDAEQQVKQTADELNKVTKKLKETETREIEARKQAQADKVAAAKQAKEAADEQIKKIALQLEQANTKARAAEVREAEIRKQAQAEKEAVAKAAKQQAEEQIKKISAERDQANKKVKEAEAREVEIRKQAQQEAEKKRQVELEEQREALEKDRDRQLLKRDADFNRERESYQKKFKVMEQQLQKKTANDLGDGAEIDLFEALRAAFPDDRMTRVRKGQARADILCEVIYKGQRCGQIIIDSKNRQGWQNGYISKLRQDQLEANAEHAILATTVFPAGKKELCIESDVVVVNPGRVVHIAYILRQAMITMHVRGLSMKERAGKMSKLYSLITSESYSRKFGEAGKLTQDILDLDVEEKKAHDKVWKRRGAAAIRINNVLREIETDVAGVIEGADDAEVPQQPDVERPKAASAESRTRETVIWNKG